MMVGDGYTSTGIVLTWASWQHGRNWSASLTFEDDGALGEWQTTAGELHTRYFCPTAGDAIDLLKADAERLGIKWINPVPVHGGEAKLYYIGDGENPEWPPPPGGFEILLVEAKRIGWDTYEIHDKEDA